MFVSFIAVNLVVCNALHVQSIYNVICVHFVLPRHDSKTNDSICPLSFIRPCLNSWLLRAASRLLSDCKHCFYVYVEFVVYHLLRPLYWHYLSAAFHYLFCVTLTHVSMHTADCLIHSYTCLYATDSLVCKLTVWTTGQVLVLCTAFLCLSDRLMLLLYTVTLSLCLLLKLND